jgi:hypothetical protein
LKFEAVVAAKPYANVNYRIVEVQAALRDSLQAINFIRRVTAGQPPGGLFLSSLAPYIQEEQIAVAHPLVRSTKLW